MHSANFLKLTFQNLLLLKYQGRVFWSVATLTIASKNVNDLEIKYLCWKKICSELSDKTGMRESVLCGFAVEILTFLFA